MRRDGATIRQRAGRALAGAAVVAGSWAIVVALSGGATIRAGAWQMGSRTALRPLLVALCCAALACTLLGAREFRRLVASAAGGRAKAPARVAALVSASVVIVSLAWNTRAAGGSDSSCYVLQAEAFAQGRVTLASALEELPPGLSPLVLAPAGFVPSPVPPHEAVPICAPGLALAMAPALLLAGREAVFVVVPLFAALAVWCTFLFGRALQDDLVGVCAALLLAASPIFLYQAVQPMSDVPAAALWLAALVAVRTSPALAGFCASAAVMMRPNVALIVLPLLALLPSVRAWLRFGVAAAPLLAVMALLNATRYGSPFSSGYGDTGVLFSLSHIAPNLARYPRWLLETQTPFIALGMAAPLVAWRAPHRRIVLVATASVMLTIATYLAYTVFDDWWYIRFLLPALPVLVVFGVIVLRRIASGMLRSGPASISATALIAICIALAGWQIGMARQRSVFALGALESRFRVTGLYAGRALPANATVLSVQHSGGIRYHGRRRTLTWDAIPPDRLDATLAWMRARGHVALIAVEKGEDARFRARFAGQAFGQLDWPPLVEVHGPMGVGIYDPVARVIFLEGGGSATAHIWR